MRSWSWQVNDTGHPVSVGRRMRQILPHPTYFEFSDEEEAVHTDGWLERHFADELVSLLLHQKPPWPKHRGKELHSEDLPRNGALRPVWRDSQGHCTPHIVRAKLDNST